MAMLAEPKRRQKLSTDPRNKSWSNDERKFGEQMMKKMGWQQGKGLGRHEDGSTSHIPVSVKNNSLGLGFSQKHDDNWINHQDGFNDLLSSLNQDHNIDDDKTISTSTKPQSLQEKSKKAKRRVHYNKFTQGKDLSTYSSTDMNCIMGVRGSCSTPNNQSRDQSGNNSDDGADSSDDCGGRAGLGFASTTRDQAIHPPDNSFGVQTIVKSTSMQEYFAQKMKELRERRSVEVPSSGSIVANSNGVSRSNTVSNSDTEPEDKESTTSAPTDTASVRPNSKESSSDMECHKTPKKKKSKRKDRKHKEEASMEDVDSQDLNMNGVSSQSYETIEEDQSNIQQDMTDSKSRKKKKKKSAVQLIDSHRDSEENAGYSEDSGKNKVHVDTSNSTDGKKRKIAHKNKNTKSKKNKARKVDKSMKDIAS